ncbi:MAG: RNA polymerase sigma factor, partial [Actinomycetota bacterium]|nr:RNA polymerase sigma factor [Actinomycetota bacterium]
MSRTGNAAKNASRGARAAAPAKTTTAKTATKPAPKSATTPAKGAAKTAAKKAPAKTSTRVSASGTATAMADDAATVIDDTPNVEILEIVAKDGAAVDPTKDVEAADEVSAEYVWDDEEESEALRQARKDAEMTASA